MQKLESIKCKYRLQFASNMRLKEKIICKKLETAICKSIVIFLEKGVYDCDDTTYKEKEITPEAWLAFTQLAHALLANNAEREKQKEKELAGIFKDQKEFDKYKSLVDRDYLYKIIDVFESEYGYDWMHSKDHGSELKERFKKSIKVKAGIITDKILKAEVIDQKEFSEALIYEIPVYKISRKNDKPHKRVGYMRLLSDGKLIRVNYKSLGNNSTLTNEPFKDCFQGVLLKYSNQQLLQIIRDLINKVDERCNIYGYKLDKSCVDSVIAYMDLKRIVKKTREALMASL